MQKSFIVDFLFKLCYNAFAQNLRIQCCFAACSDSTTYRMISRRSAVTLSCFKQGPKRNFRQQLFHYACLNFSRFRCRRLT